MHTDNEHNGGDTEDYIHPDDVLVEVEDDDGGDGQPMDDDEGEGDAGEAEEEQEADDMLGDMPGTMPGALPPDVAPDTSVTRFTQHASSVFTVATHPHAPLAVSGAGDDRGYVWDIMDGTPLAMLAGHTDSVTGVAFSSDGAMVATGGMDGNVRVWRATDEGWRTWEFLVELKGPDEVMWLRWQPKGHLLLAGANDSNVWLWQLPSGNTVQVFAGHTAAVHCGEFSPDGKHVLTACGDNRLIYWDTDSPNPLFRLTSKTARFDLGGITSLAINPASTVAVVGGAAGGVRVVSLSKGEVVGVLGGHKEGESVEAVQFVGIGSGMVVVTGGTDGKACAWDLNTMRLRTTHQHQDAITAVLAHPLPKGHLITCASADESLRTWDVRTGALVREHRGHHGVILGAALGDGGSVVVSAGDDGNCLVFRTDQPAVDI